MDSKHFKIAVWSALACLAVLVTRLFFMQVLEKADYQEQAGTNMQMHSPITASRGMIFDRRGRIMARNQVSFNVRFFPSRYTDPKSMLLKLCKALHISADRQTKLLKRLYAEESDILVAERLDDAELARFAELQDSLPDKRDGIKLETKSMRIYPFRSTASHALGYVGEIDGDTLKRMKYKGYMAGEWIGKEGVEMSHEHLLHGRSGSKIEAVDTNGTQISELSEIPASPGSDLYLALDADLQETAENALADVLNRLSWKNGERSGGAVVAIEADTGYVRALVSLPDYNPNEFSKGISSKRFSELINDPCAPLMNRAVHGSYPPGSTFKLITTSAALQEQIISPYSTFYCSGVEYVAGLPFNCFVRTGHGGINLTECLGYSCDSVYYRIGPRLGIGRLKKYANAFGVGVKTGIDLPGENSGCVPDAAWKKKYFGENWFPGDDANSSIGQGFVTASPLQMAVATAAVANGGTVYRPQLLERYRSSKAGSKEMRRVYPVITGRVPVKEGYLKAVQEGMRASTEYGTSASSGGYEIGMAGKTGTAENVPTADNPRGLNHCWFTGYVPYDRSSRSEPALVVTVFVEKSGGYGGAVAAPVAVKVASKWQALCRNSAGNQEDAGE